MNLWERHIIDSAQLINFFPKDFDKFIDIGSGAGFPGLVLKILDNKLMGHLVESNTKKAKFLSNTSKLLGIDVKIHNERFENLKKFKNDVLSIIVIWLTSKIKLEIYFPVCLFSMYSVSALMKEDNMFI